MWLQLSLVRENRDDSPQEQYDLEDLARLITKYGSEKFDAGGTKPLAWVNLLFFTGQFEKVIFRSIVPNLCPLISHQAIAYLNDKPTLRTDGVHFAIALAYYGLIRVPTRTEENDIRESS